MAEQPTADRASQWGRQTRRGLSALVLFGLYAVLVALAEFLSEQVSSPGPRGVSFGISMWYAYLMLCGLGVLTMALPARMGTPLQLGLMLAGSAVIVALSFPGLVPGIAKYFAMLATAITLCGSYLIFRSRVRRDLSGKCR